MRIGFVCVSFARITPSYSSRFILFNSVSSGCPGVSLHVSHVLFSVLSLGRMASYCEMEISADLCRNQSHITSGRSGAEGNSQRWFRESGAEGNSPILIQALEKCQPFLG